MILPKQSVRSKLLQDLKDMQKQVIESETPIYCYTYDWEEKQVSGYDICDYAEEMSNIQQASFVKRKEVYSPTVINVNKQKYYIRLESYGHSKKTKILMGPNHLAFALNKLLFDYVYAFPETEEQAKESMKQAIQEFIENQVYKDGLEMLESYQKFFGTNPEIKEFKQLCSKGYKEQQQQKKQDQQELQNIINKASKSNSNGKIPYKPYIEQQQQLTNGNGCHNKQEQSQKQQQNIKTRSGKILTQKDQNSNNTNNNTVSKNENNNNKNKKKQQPKISKNKQQQSKQKKKILLKKAIQKKK